MHACAVATEPSNGRAWLSWARTEASFQAGARARRRSALARGAQRHDDSSDEARDVNSEALGILRGPSFDAVIDVLERAVVAVPNDPYIWHYWARYELRRNASPGGRRDTRTTVLSILSRGLIECPSSAILTAEAARIEATMGHYDRARDLFERAIALDSADSHIYMEWAKMEIQCRRRSAARAVFAAGVKSVPKKDAAVLYTEFGRFEEKAGHPEQARFLYERAAASCPSDRYIWPVWAAFEERNGDVDRARKLYEQAVLVDGGNASRVWHAWGSLEFRQGNDEAARKMFERGTRADPRDASNWAAWARLEATKTGNPVEARRLFEHASQNLRAADAARLLFLHWAAFEANCNELEAACDVLRRGLKRRNSSRADSARMTHMLGQYEWRRGNLPDARRHLTSALRLSGGDVRTRHALARLLVQMSEPEEARRLLRTARRTAPLDTHILLTLAQIEAQSFADQGGIVRARSLYEDGARSSPNDAMLFRAWSSFERRYGDSASASRIRRYAMQIQDSSARTEQ